MDLLEKHREGYFLAAYYSVLAAADPLEHSPEAIYRSIREGAETSFTGGGNYPMAMAILEIGRSGGAVVMSVVIVMMAGIRPPSSRSLQ